MDQQTASEKLCLGCGAPLPPAFLDLGHTPLANAYIPPTQAPRPEETFRLAVAHCPACDLVQLVERVPPGKMFGEYLYFSSYSDSLLAHARRMATSLTERFTLGPESRVLEVASNDGYLLQFFRERGIRVLGIEPAHNIAAVARERGIPTLERFFGADAVAEILAEFGPADLVIGNNVLAHVPAINEFLSATAAVLHPAGAAVFEFPHLSELLARTEFDTIYHEHVFYYSLSAVRQLAARAGLELFAVEPQAIHGGSLRVLLQHPGTRPVGAEVRRMLAREEEEGLTSADRYASFAHAVGRLRAELLALLRGLKAEGKRIAAYGAPAKGNTLLNYCGIGTNLLDFTVDRSPHKQGMLLPGSRLPILPPDELLRRMPDYAVILPWNIADEIVAQQAAYLDAGGRFILPVPRPRILGPDRPAPPASAPTP